MGARDDALTSIEICAGAGGQAIGLHQAGFKHLALVEIDQYAAATLRRNIARREGWEFERDFCDVIEGDVNDFKPMVQLEKPVKFLDGRQLRPKELDLLAGGVPCPPFSHAGKQLGKDDERDLFPQMLHLVDELLPRAVMIENVRGIKDEKFSEYREWVQARLEGGMATDPVTGVRQMYDGAGYKVCGWRVLEASNYGVPQLRPRAILVAIRADVLNGQTFEWPVPNAQVTTVGEALEETMEKRYRPFIDAGGELGDQARKALEKWRGEANGIAPTLVGGSKKHGGADLGPSRAKAAWAKLGVNALGVANAPEDMTAKNSADRDLFRNGPMLTVTQAAIIQGFPPEWDFVGDPSESKRLPGKTAQYRQVGNAFPPPVARVVGTAIAKVLRGARPGAEPATD
ncbi:DNA (cytosine-5-)-methyltransferase [Streptomyces sp. NPDC001674]|uniref:DNA cytosine methyltransferase n=1 Tax=Streptomyces sp. NPDC001674 TaxID=3154394 RepID=UPI00332B1A55